MNPIFLPPLVTLTGRNRIGAGGWQIRNNISERRRQFTAARDAVG